MFFLLSEEGYISDIMLCWPDIRIRKFVRYMQIYARNPMLRVLVCPLLFQPHNISLFKINSQLIIYVTTPILLILLDPRFSEYGLDFLVRHWKCEYASIDRYFVV